jgi:two-component system, chemotaxis family, sensor kinase CheA
MVGECKKKPDLSGNDFLPVVLKLDELLAHLRGVREMAARLTALKDTAPGAAAAAHERAMRAESGGAAAATAPSERPPPRAVEDLSPALQSMAVRLAQDHAKRFKLKLTGLGEVPAQYAATIKDCLIQMLRNSAVHGIESPDARRAQSKDDTGIVQVVFHKMSEGYELVFEDDGAGMVPETLKAAAVKKRIISSEEAAGMDTRAAMALIFRPGFSTQEDVSMDAGRGVGMDVVARSVYALGGKIGVSTHPGKFTRFKIILPAAEAVSTAVA